MRLIAIFMSVSAFSPSISGAAEPLTAAPQLETAEFQLGGAASRTAIVPNLTLRDEAAPPRRRLSLPLSPDSLQPQQSRDFGPATIFVGQGQDDGRDAVQMGTFLSRGLARAGVSVTYLEKEEEVSRSEIFMDFSLTENFSVGVSGILSTDDDLEDSPPTLGLSAEYTTDSGAYLQGGFADAAEFDPVFGLSLGFRF